MAHLFVYGTLRKTFSAYSLVEDYFSFVCNAQTKGKLYDEGSFPAAVSTEEDVFIQGELHQIKNDGHFEEAFGKLDEYEEVNEGLFRRELTIVFAGNNLVTSWIYWYNKRVENLVVIESGDAVEYYNNQKNKVK